MSPDPDSEPPWVPRADIFLNSFGEFIIKVELAAMCRENLDLCIEGDRLKITGQRADGDATRFVRHQYCARGIAWGAFELVVPVPASFDLNRANAMYANGILRVRIPPSVLSD